MSWVRPAIQRILLRVTRLVCRHPKPIIFFSILLTLGGVYLTIFRLGVINDTNALIRQDSPALRNFLTYVKEFNAADPLVIMIQSPDFDQNRQVAEALAGKISSRPNEIQKVYYRNDLSKLKPHFLLYEDKAKLEEILKQIRAQSGLLQGKTDGGVNLNSLLSEALNQFDRVEKAKGKRGTLDDLGAFADRMIQDLEKLANQLAKPVNESSDLAVNKSPEEEGLDHQLLLNTYLSFEDGKLLLVMITPGEGDKESFSPQETTIRHLRHDINEIKKLYPHVSIGLTGEPVLLDDELKASTRDVMVASIIAFLLISGLFFFAYREFTRPALAIFSLVSALFWSLGFAALAVGHLNIISQAFVLMLLGLGIDFGIQILGRYEEERAEGKDVFKALEEAVQFTGTAVVTGGGITAIAFFTMCFNDFLGLAELGAIAGTGMIFCMAANLILLPALLAWRDAGKKLSLPEHHHKHAALGRKLDDLLQSQPWLSLVIVTVITAGAIFEARKVEFDHNLLNLQSPTIESVKLAKQLLNSPANSFLFGVIVANDLDDAKKKTAILESLPTVRDVSSPTKILPEDQEEKLKILGEIRKELNQLKFNPDVSKEVNVAEAQKHLQTLLEYSRKGLAQAGKFRQAKDPRAQQAFDIFERLIPALEKAVASLHSLSQEEAGKRLNRFQMEIFMQMKREFEFLKSFDMETLVGLDALPPEALHHYISPNNKILLEVHPKENVWEREPNERFVKDLRSVDANATGTPVQNYVYIEILKKSFVEAALWAFAAIVLVVGLYFKHLGRLVLTLIPLVTGIIWTLGVMGLFDIKFNPANIITLPLVIGIGVAYGVYIMDRYLEEGRVHLFGTSTGKAVLLSALTTIFGFAVMMIGSHRGMVSLGLVMTIGICFCFITSTWILPPLLALVERWKSRRLAHKKQH